jgi:tRNA(adenine34) deaminase
MQNHQFYMEKALTLAQRAFKIDEVPVGALIVNSHGEIIARAFNKSECSLTQIAHAELLAIAKAGKKVRDWRLQGCWLYVTLEPCAMCMNAIILSRIEGVVFGAESPLFGYHKFDKDMPSWLYKRDNLAIIGGICQEDSRRLLQEFFKKKRKGNSD